MPQKDRHRERIVPIEFETDETFAEMPADERMTIVLITQGMASFILNGEAVTVNAPCVMLLSCYDSLKIVDKSRLAAKSFSFNPSFINSALTFESLKDDKFSDIEDEHDRNMMNMFLKRNEKYLGYIDIPSGAYLRISEWLSIIGTETFSQSDGKWTCRIRRYLLQTLYLIDEIYDSKQRGNARAVKEPVNIALEYIQVNYPNEITLDGICRLANINRTTLNKRFKEKVGMTVIEYLVHYRIKIACEALSHTNLTISEIAEATGFKYDTYFIRQFEKKIGISPARYRNEAWKRL